MKILMVAPRPFFTPRGTPFSVCYRIWVTRELGHIVDIGRRAQQWYLDRYSRTAYTTKMMKLLSLVT